MGLCTCMLSRFSHVQLFSTLQTVARQAPLSMGFSRQEHWSGLPFRSPGDLLHTGIKLVSLAVPALDADSLLLSRWGNLLNGLRGSPKRETRFLLFLSCPPCLTLLSRSRPQGREFANNFKLIYQKYYSTKCIISFNNPMRWVFLLSPFSDKKLSCFRSCSW